MKRLWFILSLVLLMGCDDPTDESPDPVYTYPTEITYKIGDPVPAWKDILVIQDEDGTVVDTLDYTVRYSNLSWLIVGSYPIAINHNGESHDVIVHVELDYTFELLGEEHVVLEFGESYTDPGYRLVDHNGNEITEIHEWSSSTPVLDVNTYGDYILEYHFSAHGVEDSLTRTIRVHDATPPVGIVQESRSTFLSQELPLNWNRFFHFTDDTELDVTYTIYDDNDNERTSLDGDGRYILEAVATDIHDNTTTLQKEIVIVTLPTSSTNYHDVRAPWRFSMDELIPVPSYYFEQNLLPYEDDVLFIGLNEDNETGSYLSRRSFDESLFRHAEWTVDLPNYPHILSYQETLEGFRMIYYVRYQDITVLEMSGDGDVLVKRSIDFPNGYDSLVHSARFANDLLYVALEDDDGLHVPFTMTLDGTFTRMDYEDNTVDNLRLEWVDVLNGYAHLMYKYDLEGERHHRIVRMDESTATIVLDQEGHLYDQYHLDDDGSVYRWNNSRIERLNSDFQVLNQLEFDCLSNIRLAVADTRLYVIGSTKAMCTTYTDTIPWTNGQALLVLDRTDLSLLQSGVIANPNVWPRRIITKGDDLMMLFYEDTEADRNGYVYIMNANEVYDMGVPSILEGNLTDLAAMDLTNQPWLQSIPNDDGFTVHLDHIQAVDGVQSIFYTFTVDGTPYHLEQPYHYRAGTAPSLSCSFSDTLITPDMETLMALCQATDEEDGDLSDTITVHRAPASTDYPEHTYLVQVTDSDGYTTERLVTVLWLQEDTAFTIEHNWHDHVIHELLPLDMWRHVTIETIPDQGLFLVSYAYGEEVARVALPELTSGSYRLGMFEDDILLYGDYSLSDEGWSHLTLPPDHPGNAALLFDASLELLASPNYNRLPGSISSEWLTLIVRNNTIFLAQQYVISISPQYQTLPLDTFDGTYQSMYYGHYNRRYIAMDDSGYYINHQDGDDYPDLAYVEHYDWNNQLLGTIPFGAPASGSDTYIQALAILDDQLCAYVYYYHEDTLTTAFDVPLGVALMCVNDDGVAVPKYLIDSIERNVRFLGDSHAYLEDGTLAFQTHDVTGQQTVSLMNTRFLTDRHYAGHVFYGTITGPTQALGKSDYEVQQVRTTVHVWTIHHTGVPYDETTNHVTDVLRLEHNDAPTTYTVLDTKMIDGTWHALIQPTGFDTMMLIPVASE